jgi:hypothetical protein
MQRPRNKQQMISRLCLGPKSETYYDIYNPLLFNDHDTNDEIIFKPVFSRA